ncbi:hypothetical protein GCM10027184_57070 [Saccharothrix stipae]
MRRCPAIQLSAKGKRKEGSAKEQSSHARGNCREAPGRTFLVLTDRVTPLTLTVKMPRGDHSTGARRDNAELPL